MSSQKAIPKYHDFPSILSHLLTNPAPVLPPACVFSPSLSGPIAALSLHPTLEAALHILNRDLPSAHFLVRHMQAEPAFEGMFLHGILHRVEGDYDNARAWYANIAHTPVFHSVWTSENALEDARAFITRIESLRKEKDGDEEALERESRREIEAVIQWCRDKFGEDEMKDATKEWVQPRKDIRDIGEKMITGGEGWRILATQSATLTNHEVLSHLLTLRTRTQCHPPKSPNYESVIRDVTTHLSPSPPNTLRPRPPPSYLPTSPPSHETLLATLLTTLIASLKPYNLLKTEVLQIANLAPESTAQLVPIVEELEMRYSDEEQEGILGVVRGVFGLGEGVNREGENGEGGMLEEEEGGGGGGGGGGN